MVTSVAVLAHALSVRLRQVHESHEAPRGAGPAERRGGRAHHLPALLPPVLHALPAPVSPGERPQSLRVHQCVCFALVVCLGGFSVGLNLLRKVFLFHPAEKTT